MNEMIRRVAVTQATVDTWKDKPFAWGSVDCVRMAAAHLRRAGHQVRLPPSGSYRSAMTAKRRLAERGYADLLAAMDGEGYDRIPPAMVLPGDIIAGERDGIGSLGVFLGNGRVLAFHDDAQGAVVIQPMELAAAWRVPFRHEGA